MQKHSKREKKSKWYSLLTFHNLTRFKFFAQQKSIINLENFREAEIIRKRKEYEEKLLKERKVYKTEVEQQKKREQILEKELKQWILMQRLRRDEIDKLHDMKKKESKWATKMTVREGYNKQLVYSLSFIFQN